MNKNYGIYDVSKIKKYLKPGTIIIKVNYYRFNGFWFNSRYNPYLEYKNFKFHPKLGIDNGFRDFKGDKKQIIDKINNIQMKKKEVVNYFLEELEKFKNLDNNSDISMYEFFVKNYKSKHLFHDRFHPTNTFFYEMFKQILFLISDHQLPDEDMNFINSIKNEEMSHWAIPVLPIIKKYLGLTIPEKIGVFFPNTKRLYMDIYDYYYIRLSKNNFNKYLVACKY